MSRCNTFYNSCETVQSCRRGKGGLRLSGYRHTGSSGQKTGRDQQREPQNENRPEEQNELTGGGGSFPDDGRETARPPLQEARSDRVRRAPGARPEPCSFERACEAARRLTVTL
jgi:hypothetical protein